MSHGARYTLHVQQGASLILRLHYTDKDGNPAVDLTDYEAVLQIRRAMATADPVLEITSDDGEITFDSVDGKIEATLPVTKIDDLPTHHQPAEDWVWGIQIYDPQDPDSTTRMLLTGLAYIYPSPVRTP